MFYCLFVFHNILNFVVWLFLVVFFVFFVFLFVFFCCCFFLIDFLQYIKYHINESMSQLIY